MTAPSPPRESQPWSANGASNNGTPKRVSSDSIQRLVVLGYITAVAMPPVGFILGVLLAVRLDRPNSKRGAWIVALSIAAAAVWFLLLTTGLLNPNSDQSTF